MEYIHTVKKYTVLLTTEEVLECDNLKVLYNAVRRRIRWGDEKFTAYFYKNINWWGKWLQGKDTFLPDGTGVICSLWERRNPFPFFSGIFI